MGSAARSTRSNAAPAGRQSHEARSTQRPQLHVVSNRSANGSAKRGLAAFWAWTKSRSTPLVHIVVAVVFLGACLLGALLGGVDDAGKGVAGIEQIEDLSLIHI